MTELTREELEARWRKNREEEAVRQAEKEKATKPLFMRMCELLLARDIHFVEVEYDGAGDSGCIETVSYSDEHGEYSPQPPISTDFLPGWKTFGGQELDLETGVRKRQEVDGTVEDFIEDFVYERLPGGWEINEGSFGTFKIDLKEKSWDSSHMIRTYSVEDFGMSGSYED
jgi:hypothetical protein